MQWVGIDGCKAGWIAVWIDVAGDRGWTIVSNGIDAIEKWNAKLILIDVPIGLPDKGKGHRDCDKKARKKLGPAYRSVFLGANRALLECKNRAYPEANAWAKKMLGTGLTRQFHAILHKIAEVDAFMTPERQHSVRETHPELIFQRLNDGKALFGDLKKKKRAGKERRRQLLEKAGFNKLGEWIAALPRKEANVDDLLDACAAAITAREPMQLHCELECDGKGLRMEMCY